MHVQLHRAGEAHARELIKAGNVDRAAAWPADAVAGDQLLGAKGDDWAAYGAFHLGENASAKENTKERFAYAFGKAGSVYRSALVSIRGRVSEQDEKELFAAAGALLEEIDGKEDDKGKKKGERALLRLEALSGAWAIVPECLPQLATLAAAEHVVEKTAGPVVRREGAIAVIPVRGVIGQRASWMTDTSTEAVGGALAQALGDESVSGVVLDIDSPGGSVYGVAELGAQIRASGKPVYAIANGLAASAAYWLGSSADKLFVTPSGEVGSIGVISMHGDFSKMLDNAGVKVSLITAGKYKGEANPYQPLSDDARAAIQDRVNTYYGEFTRAVAKGRGVPVSNVRDGMGQGRVVGADQALEQKMVDGVATLPGVIGQLVQDMSGDQAKKGPRMEDAAAKPSAELLAAAEKKGSAEQLARVRALLDCDEAKERAQLARHLAFETDQTVDAAKKLLAAAPKDGAANALAAAMGSLRQPVVGADLEVHDVQPKALGANEIYEARRKASRT